MAKLRRDYYRCSCQLHFGVTPVKLAVENAKLAVESAGMIERKGGRLVGDFNLRTLWGAKFRGYLLTSLLKS